MAIGFVLGAAFPGVIRKIREYAQAKAADAKKRL